MPFARSCSLTAAAIVIAFACAAGVASAQTSRPVSVVFGANVGIARPATAVFASVLADTAGSDSVELRGDYPVDHGPIVDLHGGVIVGPGLFLGAAFTRTTSSAPGSMTFTLSHPAFHPTLTATTETESLDRSETGMHLQFGYALPTRGRVGVVVFGGPSYMRVHQPLVADIYLDELFDSATRTYRAVASDPSAEKMSADAWGYNVGADVSWALTRHIGLGGLVRYSRATVSLENPLTSSLEDRVQNDDFKAGGFELSTGVRFRF